MIFTSTSSGLRSAWPRAMSFDFLFERLGVFQHRQLDDYTRLDEQRR